jgi:glutathione S-transferase
MLKLNVLKPSVNNMAVRVLVRAGNLDFSEADAWGHTRSPEFLAKCPAHMTPMIEGEGLPKGVLWESCAIMQYLCGKHGLAELYPTDLAGRAMVDSAMYPALGFPLYPGEVGASDAGDDAKAGARKAAEDAIAEPLAVFKGFYIGDEKFIGGTTPSIADIRLACTLEFLGAVDYVLPAWAKTYMSNVEAAFGKAYSEPAADVRGYISHVKSQKNRGSP